MDPLLLWNNWTKASNISELVTPIDGATAATTSFHPSGNFFDVYYSKSRFICETLVAVMATIANVTAVVLTLCRRQGEMTVHHVLFVNLGVSNTLSSIIAWFSNNALYLFDRHLAELLLGEADLCTFFAYLSTGVFLSSASGLVSSCTVMGFITVQYIAICKPLEEPILVTRRKVSIYVISLWAVAFLMGSLPCVTLLALLRHATCDATLLSTCVKLLIVCVNYHVTVVGLVDVAAIGLCARIYHEIRKLNRRLSLFRFERDITRQKRHFVTSVMLLGVMTFSVIPYTLLYVITLNIRDTVNLHDDLLVYYMNLLPHAKFLSDPIVYGLRMREMHNFLFRSWYWIRSLCARAEAKQFQSARRTKYSSSALCSTSL
ncbi:hypothetical protein LSH36_892g00017 [Paralvinella palmiformis]|uniref:G-protein coupled receptors family 1 profile domain-containing protein n=1 Tax=Paralvinella palmiformis TaxID=53620 RepID=A0AAD9IYK2_9ANNE|nr:hypothetical protein LSH36_892g00017 [Paralvinella palmiformis]